jgi:hypothetical protein
MMVPTEKAIIAAKIVVDVLKSTYKKSVKHVKVNSKHQKMERSIARLNAGNLRR